MEVPPCLDFEEGVDFSGHDCRCMGPAGTALEVSGLPTAAHCAALCGPLLFARPLAPRVEGLLLGLNVSARRLKLVLSAFAQPTSDVGFAETQGGHYADGWRRPKAAPMGRVCPISAALVAEFGEIEECVVGASGVGAGGVAGAALAGLGSMIRGSGLGTDPNPNP